MTEKEIRALESRIDERAKAWLVHIKQCDDYGNCSSYADGYLDGIEFAITQLEDWIKEKSESGGGGK